MKSEIFLPSFLTSFFVILVSDFKSKGSPKEAFTKTNKLRRLRNQGKTSKPNINLLLLPLYPEALAKGYSIPFVNQISNIEYLS